MVHSSFVKTLSVLPENASNESVSGTVDIDSDKVQGVLLCTAWSAAVGGKHIQGMNLPLHINHLKVF